MTNEGLDAAAAAASKAAVAASGMTVVWGFVTDNIMGVVGVVTAMATMIIGWYYKDKARQRAEADEARRQLLTELQAEERRLRIERLRRGMEIPLMAPEPTIPAPLAEVEDDE